MVWPILRLAATSTLDVGTVWLSEYWVASMLGLKYKNKRGFPTTRPPSFSCRYRSRVEASEKGR